MLKFRDILIPAFLILLAVAIQTQTTLFKSADYSGLRLNLADLLLPLAGLGILASLLRRKSLWPAWTLKHIYLWLAGLGAVLTAALLHTHIIFGQWSEWALLNKITGWPVLVAYLALGGWLATNLSPKKLTLFIKAFAAFFILILLALIAAMMIQHFSPLSFRSYVWFPIEGLMGNRNAFALLFLAVLAIVTTLHIRCPGILPKPLVYGLWFLLPAGFIFNGSRALLLALPVMFVFALPVFRAKILPLLIPFALGAALMAGIYAGQMDKLLFFKWKQLDSVRYIEEVAHGETLENIEQDIRHVGDSNRLKVIQDSLEMLKERPFFGSGLGSGPIYQEQKREQAVDIIDSTPLWLWVETGIPGLLAFAAFYFTCLINLWRRAKEDGLPGALSQSLLLILIGFAVMSLLHEMMYSRFLWLLLGMALVHQNQSSAPQTNPVKA